MILTPSTYLLSLVLLLHSSLLHAKLSLYQSDTSFEHYIQRQFCPSAMMPQSRQLTVLLHIQSNNSLFNGKYRGCFQLHLPDTDLPQVGAFINSTSELRLKWVHVVLEITSVQSLSTEASRRMLTTLQHLYLNFPQVRALYIAVNEPTSERLLKWTSWLLSASDKDFSAVVVANGQSPAFYIRPVLDGCHLHHKVFIPRNATDLARLRANYRQCRLAHTSLKVAAKSYVPFCHLLRQPDGSYTFDDRYPLESAILAILQHKFQFKIKLLVVSTNHSWGGHDTLTHQYRGLAMNIANRSADMGICGLARTLERSKLIDFTAHTYYDDLTFLTLRPRLLPRDWILLRPFSLQIWLCIIASCLLLTLLICCSSHLVQYNSSKSFYNFSALVVSTFFTLLQLLIGKSTNLRQCKFNHLNRCLLIIWMFSTLILTVQYNALFYPILTLPNMERPLDSTEDLLEAFESEGKYLLTTNTFSSIFTTSKKDNTVYYRLGKYINRTRPKFLQVSQYMDLLKRQSGRVVTIQSRLILRAIAAMYGKWMFHIAADNLNVNVLAIGLPKRSPLLDPFNMVIAQMQETGLPEKLISDTFKAGQRTNSQSLAQLQSIVKWYPPPTEDNSPDASTSQFTSLTFEDVSSIFLLFSIGLLITVVVFLLELATTHLFRQIKC